MDPLAALLTADQAISDCDAPRAAEALRNYRQWRKNGGFEPFVTSDNRRGDEFAERCDNRLASLRTQLAQWFTVTYEIVTPESAEHGDVDERGFIDSCASVREALRQLRRTRTNRVDGVESISCGGDDKHGPRYITITNGREFETGAQESRTMRIPPHITPASARRIARLAGVSYPV